MQIRIDPHDDVSVVIIEGSIDSLTADAVLDALDAHVAAGHTRLVADLAACDYTSSAGLRALLSTVKATRSRGGDLRLAAATPNVFKVLDLSGFTTILKLFDSVEAARASFGQQAG